MLGHHGAPAQIVLDACAHRHVATVQLDLGGAGQTWDEDVNWAAGRNYVTNLLDGDFSVLAWRWNYEHPPVMKILAGIGAQLADGFGPARALSALWVRPELGALVEIAEFTNDGLVRHASFVDLV